MQGRGMGKSRQETPVNHMANGRENRNMALNLTWNLKKRAK